MLGTKLEAFSNTDDEDRNNYIKQMLRRKRSEMVNDAKQPRSCSDNNGTTASTPPPVVQRAQGGLAMIIEDEPSTALPPKLPRLPPRRRFLRAQEEVAEERSPPAKKQAAPPVLPSAERPPLRARNDDCVAKIEALQAKREARRMRAAESKQQRALEEAAALDAGVGVEHVDFLRLLAEHRRDQGLEPQRQARPSGYDVWCDKADTSRIRVVVRKRPMLKPEKLRHDVDIVDVANDTVFVHEPLTRVDCSKGCATHSFAFDAAFSEADTNDGVYESTVRPLVEHVTGGCKDGKDGKGSKGSKGSKVDGSTTGTATVFAFGQTGSGKTLTMSGLYALAARDLLAAAAARGLGVSVACFEVYRGHVYDLLGGRARLDVQEDAYGRVCVPGLVEEAVEHADALREAVARAEALRAVGTTSANDASSRSHALVQMRLRRTSDGAPLDSTLAGTLTLVDLAGSERACDAAGADRQTRVEGAEINKSLLALKECIRALDAPSGAHGAAAAHVPFRGSKLTHVLRDAFVGDAKTVMIATIAPGAASSEHTLGTLRYAQRVRSFGGRPDRMPHVVNAGRAPPRAKQRARASAVGKPGMGASPSSAPAELPSPARGCAAPRSAAEEMSAAGPALVLPPLRKAALCETKQGW